MGRDRVSLRAGIDGDAAENCGKEAWQWEGLGEGGMG